MCKQNNKWKYQGDTRYEKVYEKMQLLGIQDITTDRQHKNGTVVWRLPIKNNWPQVNAVTYIEVASFKTGYVRNQNSGYSNYQLNKRCEGEPEYFDTGKTDSIGRPLYRKFSTRSCVLIPIEIDRLEYLISYCLKNYYIKRANEVANGELIPKWKYESYKNEYKNRVNEVNNCERNAFIIQELEAKVSILEKELENRPALNNLSVTVNGERYKII